MSKRTRLLGLVMLSIAPALFAESPVALLRTGSFHGDEVAGDRAGSWLALVLDSNGASLQNVRASITLEEDPLVDEEGAISGKNVAISPPLEAVALLRGVTALEPGRIPTVLAGQAIEAGRTIRVQIGKEKYSLEVRCVERPAVDGQGQHDCRLTMRAGTRVGTNEEMLFTYDAYTEEGRMLWSSEHPPTVIWAGDIDGDHRLDLLLDTSNHYNVDAMTLYLSSAAGPGRLLGIAATFQSVGC